RDWIDPYSSAPWFEGFHTSPRTCGQYWLTSLQRQPRPTAAPRTWLLATGWRRHGLLLPTEVPGGRR
ncbi:MAG TPA: hypothetical protein PKU97_16205, partial [Kofleriaceae bacterium]|nr:hypothetical protein [Kofleriaceae bacterium]